MSGGGWLGFGSVKPRAAGNGARPAAARRYACQPSRMLYRIGFGCAAALAATTLAHADEGGVPFWFSGQMASLSATAPSHGVTLGVLGIGYTGSASASKQFEIGNNLVADLHATAPVSIFQLGYAPDAKFLGAQPYVAMAFGAGFNQTTAGITLGDHPISLSRTDSKFGITDLYPYVSLSWTGGVNHFMVYGTGDIPVGAYSASRLSNLGIGHGAADIGAGYTYFNPTNGRELTAVAGVTFNTENTSSNYTNGVDAHLDWAVSQFLSESLEIGVAGYVYDQLSGDSGAGDRLGAFESKVASIGPEIGHPFVVAGRPAYINVRAYYEFWAENRVRGEAAFLTLAFPLGKSPTH